jgi:hypothetical protein
MGRGQRLLVSLSFYFVFVGGFIAAGFHHHAALKNPRHVSTATVPSRPGPARPGRPQYFIEIDGGTACSLSDRDQICREILRQACTGGLRLLCRGGSGSTISSTDTVSFSPRITPLYYTP